MRTALIAAFIFLAGNIFAQPEHLSIQAREYIFHRTAEAGSRDHVCPDAVSPILKFKSDTTHFLFSGSKIGKRISYGFHPYWSSDATIKNYHWDLLSHVGYFGADIDPLTGNISNTHNWKSTTIRDTAHRYGVKVELVTILFSKHDSLLLYPVRRAKAIENLVKLVRDYKGDGINIDFEAIPKTSKSGFLAFVKDLREYVAGDTTFSISIDLPAIDWSDIFDLSYLGQYIDLFFMMGYDYYWAAAPSAGPVAPLDLGYYNLRRSVATYIAGGLAPKQFVLGLPWYGYDWPTKDSVAPGSETLGNAEARIPGDAIEESAMFGRLWNDAGKSAYYYYLQNDTIHQVWYDDETSLAAKYQLANENDLIGIGYWAVLYAASRTTFWDEIEKALTTPSSVFVGGGKEEIIAYPNPARDVLHLSMSAEYDIYNSLGQRVTSGFGTSISISSLVNGSYILRTSRGTLTFLVNR